MLYFSQVIKLDILFKNTTTYSSENHKKYLEFHSKKFKNRYNFYTIYIICFALFFIALNVFYSNMDIAIFLTILLTAFILYRFFHPIRVVSEDIKNNKVSETRTITFSFYKKYFSVTDRKKRRICKILTII